MQGGSLIDRERAAGSIPRLARLGKTLGGRKAVTNDISMPRIRVQSRDDSTAMRNIILFALLCVLWILGEAISHSGQVVQHYAAMIAPHIASKAFVVALVLLPPRKLWLAALLFLALYGGSFLVPQMRTLPIEGAEAQLMVHALAFEVNFALALIIGMIARNSGDWLVRLFPEVDRRVLQVITAGALVALLSPLAYLALWGIGGALRLPGWSEIGLSLDQIARTVQRGVWGGLVVGMFLLLISFPIKRLDLTFSIVSALSIAAIVIGWKLGLSEFPELELAVALLILSMALPAGTSAILILFISVVIPLLTWFSVAPEPMEGHRHFTLDVLTVAVLCGVAFVIVVKYAVRSAAHRQSVTEERLERLYDFADVGRFSVDLRGGVAWIDPAAQRMTGMPARFPIAAFMRLVHAEDAAALTRAFSDQTGQNRIVSAQISPEEGGNHRVVKFYFWYQKAAKGDHFAHGFVVDVTEEHDRGVELESALAKLSEKQQFQSELFSMVSHELRTPASLISMFIEKMDEGEQWSAIGPKMKKVTAELLETLADIRQTVQPEKNLPVSLRPIVPIELMEEIKANYDLAAGNKNVGIEILVGNGTFDTSEGDVHRLRQAIANLLRNAILHSDCTTISLSYEAHETSEGRVGLWSVEDDGRGIPAQDVDLLFEPFQRGPDMPDKADGSGLGLYIVKSSIELLGGSVTYKPGRNGGARFELRVPEFRNAQTRGADAPQGAAVVPDRPRSRPSDAHRDKVQAHVLLAEDHQMIREVMGGTLRKMFARVSLAETGTEALQIFRSDKPDLVITDLFMPQMCGDELTTEIRRYDKSVPVIGITAAIMGDDAARFRAAGATAVLAKPLTRLQLEALSDEYLGATANTSGRGAVA
ncbi:hybrid sensor histidine kinase/response regulator [Meridianimarinicoccus roseus]|nr:hybrid sensor histidine kinase/response regulator [Meridianimarinicoccus roseus]